MILAIDIGNTETAVGLLDDTSICQLWKLETDRYKTSDEYVVILRGLFDVHGIDPAQISGGIISSVVPAMQNVLDTAIRRITGFSSLVVGPGLKNGLKIRIDDPAQLGSDRVAEAVAAVAEYPLPVVIFSMGTATTFSVINREGEVIGGLLMPGAVIAQDALAQMTAKLPQVDLTMSPRQVIGRNTVESMQSGFVYGTAAMADGVIDRIAKDLGEEPMVVAGNELAGTIAPHCRHEMICDPELLMKGLRLIYRRNQKA